MHRIGSDQERAKRMYNTGYTTINGGGFPRGFQLTPRRLFYGILTIVLGGMLIIAWTGAQKAHHHAAVHQEINKYRAQHHGVEGEFYDHHGHGHGKHEEEHEHDTHHDLEHDSHEHKHDHSHHDYNHYEHDHRDHHHHQQEHEHLPSLHDHHHHHHHEDHSKGGDHGHEDLVPFHPTTEWQKVPHNAPLPAGLEISINFATGERMARLPHSGPMNPKEAPVAVSPPFVADNNERPHDHAEQRPKETTPKTIIEERLDAIVSPDDQTRHQALEWLEVEAHRLSIGEAVTHSRNFDNLVHLLEDPFETTRFLAASIIAACVNGNPGAVDGALMAGLARRLTERLAQEKDARVQRMLVATLSYTAQHDPVGTMHQFVPASGFVTLERMASLGMDAALHERVMVLLATLARDEAADYKHQALVLLDKHLPLMHQPLNEVYHEVFRPLCIVESHAQPLRHHNFVNYCKAHIKH